MGSSQTFLEIFSTEPGATTGISFARYMELAMYHPTAGYYTRDFRRVGKDKAADFFTATTFSPVFGELVVAAAVKLLGDQPPGELIFVEIGAEPAGGALKNVAHPFAEYRTISFGQPITLPPRCVAFSNELFDAQPFHRVVHRNGTWRELGVAEEADDGNASQGRAEKGRIDPCDPVQGRTAGGAGLGQPDLASADRSAR